MMMKQHNDDKSIISGFSLQFKPFLFQSQNKTLTDIDIERELKNIINQILTIESVSIPGLK